MTHYDPQKHHRQSMRLKDYDYTQAGAYFITIVAYHRDEIFGQIVNGEMHLSALGQIAHDEWMRSANLRQEICLNEDEFIIMPNHIHGIVWMVVGADGVRPMGKEGACHAPLPADMPDPNDSNDGVRPNHAIDDIRPMVDIVGADGVLPIGEEGACHAPLPAGMPDPNDSNDGVRPNNANNGLRPMGNDVGADGVRPNSNDRIPPMGEESACHTTLTGVQGAPLPKRVPRSLSSFVAGFKAAVTSRSGRELDMTGIWQRNYYDHIIRNEEDFLNIWRYIDSNPQKWQQDQLHPSASENRFNRE